VFSYKEFINDILNIKKEYGSHKNPYSPIILDVPYLRYPEHQTIFILPDKFNHLIYEQVTLLYQNLQNAEWYGTANKGFFNWEADKFKRIYEMAIHNKVENHTLKNRMDFIKFVDEHDVRRGTNFLETFPEFEETYKEWKNL